MWPPIPGGGGLIRLFGTERPIASRCIFRFNARRRPPTACDTDLYDGLSVAVKAVYGSSLTDGNAAERTILLRGGYSYD